MPSVNLIYPRWTCSCGITRIEYGSCDKCGAEAVGAHFDASLKKTIDTVYIDRRGAAERHPLDWTGKLADLSDEERKQYRCADFAVKEVEEKACQPILDKMYELLMRGHSDFMALVEIAKAHRDQTLSQSEYDRLTALIEKYDKP
jgi:hypothetical protein